MINGIRHKGLRGYWTKGQVKGLRGDWIARLRRIMLALDVAGEPETMNVPGAHFHELSGKRTGTYSVRLTGNYRVTFRWIAGKGATDVDIEDYH